MHLPNRYQMLVFGLLCLSSASLYVARESTAAAPAPTGVLDDIDPDRHYLPDITGLSRPPADEFTRPAGVVKSEVKALTLGDKDSGDAKISIKDRKCRTLDKNLRAMVFSHWSRIHSLDPKAGFITAAEIQMMAKVMGKILGESSGDSTNVTDPETSKRTFATYKAMTNINRWYQILDQKKKNPAFIYNERTNYGIAQMSPDRLTTRFYGPALNSMPGIVHGTRPVEAGDKGVSSAIKARRLFWTYQDFAQGRLQQSDQRIEEKDKNKPEFRERYQQGLKEVLWHCGTRYLFEEGDQGAAGIEKLTKAVDSIAYCKIGYFDRGRKREHYGETAEDRACFAKWVTICPALNIDLALLAPDRYFETNNPRNPPICKETLEMIASKINLAKAKASEAAAAARKAGATTGTCATDHNSGTQPGTSVPPLLESAVSRVAAPAACPSPSPTPSQRPKSIRAKFRKLFGR